jgi:hypothetical protein
MAKNQESSEFLTKLAVITEASQNVINGKVTIIFEVNNEEYDKCLSKVGNVEKNDSEQFKIDISGTDIIFILDK